MPNAPIPPQNVVTELERHILVDGFKLVVDLEHSKGCRFIDAATGRELIDLYSFYASMPLGFNHPALDEPKAQAALHRAARTKVANADVYSVEYATFVRTFFRVMGLPPLERLFFVDGGALAVENALKTAMDWKVRKNIAAGRGERGTDVLHFDQAFHGRSGYTLSLTNTDPRKTDYFAKFPWPRVTAPRLDFSLPIKERESKVVLDEARAEADVRRVFQERPHDVCAIIIEPIQGEGGDHHFRGEWLQTLRRIADEQDALLIFDEVQSGMGLTGKRWACEHFDVCPDLLSFGKKAQVCGVMAGPRIDEVRDNTFRLPSRISSTWGGNFTDMVRSTIYLEVIEREHLIDNARDVGAYFLESLEETAREFPIVSQVRGRGLMLAFTLPDRATRDRFWTGCYEVGLLTVRCGERSIRLRPVLDIASSDVDDAIAMIREECRRIR
ncbi:MAG: L-lysine 6-transaminase [Deltaproteobacteria bacterium]|nr:L-lysine 6-transaminase [Deltaproteobacteria bacterium]